MALLKEASDSVNSFYLKLHGQLCKNSPNGNLFYSPTSVCVALAMTYAGAKANTAKELEQAMHWNSPDTVHEMMKELQQSLFPSTGTSGIELRLASRLWAQEGFAILNEFTEVLRDCYQAEMGAEDFCSKTEEARRGINSWVEEKTNNKIKNLLTAGVLSADTKLVLVNAGYFKGFWQDEFQPSKTHDHNFHITKTQTTKVKLMNQTAHFLYAEDKNLSCQILRLPYKQEKVAMVIFLPDELDGLAKLEEKINADHLKRCNDMLRNTKVHVSLPKFKVECKFFLQDVLVKLGICSLFSGTADLSGMTGNKDLFVSKVVHQAFVDVNEQGTEAAAATAVMGRLVECSLQNLPPHFLANHPFLFFMQHCKSGAVLFAGRVLNPSSN